LGFSLIRGTDSCVQIKGNEMNSIKQYRTVSTPLRDELDSIINDLLKEGFQPYGSPYAVTQDHSQVFCQAMVSFSAPKPAKSRAVLLLDPKLNPQPGSSSTGGFVKQE
jgi:hypothetical protein